MKRKYLENLLWKILKESERPLTTQEIMDKLKYMEGPNKEWRQYVGFYSIVNLLRILRAKGRIKRRIRNPQRNYKTGEWSVK